MKIKLYPLAALLFLTMLFGVVQSSAKISGVCLPDSKEDCQRCDDRNSTCLVKRKADHQASSHRHKADCDKSNSTCSRCSSLGISPFIAVRLSATPDLEIFGGITLNCCNNYLNIVQRPPVPPPVHFS